MGRRGRTYAHPALLASRETISSHPASFNSLARNRCTSMSARLIIRLAKSAGKSQFTRKNARIAGPGQIRAPLAKNLFDRPLTRSGGDEVLVSHVDHAGFRLPLPGVVVEVSAAICGTP